MQSRIEIPPTWYTLLGATCTCTCKWALDLISTIRWENVGEGEGGGRGLSADPLSQDHSTMVEITDNLHLHVCLRVEGVGKGRQVTTESSLIDYPYVYAYRHAQ